MKYTLKSCIRWGSAGLVALAMHSTLAQTVHISHCLAGCPDGAPATNEIVVRHLFAASINNQTGLADWVAYRVLPGSVGVASLLLREWQADELLAQVVPDNLDAAPTLAQPDLSNAQDREYRVSEVVVDAADRGRLVPMSSFAGTPYWQDLNYLSNMAPIPGELRIGPWSRLDQAVNEFAQRSGTDVFIVSGPLYRNMGSTAGSPANNQPEAYFKFVATDSAHAAFVFPFNAAQHSSYCDQITSMEQMQDRSGLILLPLQADPGSATLHEQLGCSEHRNTE